MSFLNLGVVAHVDAGKTSLTERLLYAGGVIDTIGSVDAGSTRTDSLELERRRGITIKTAVASFPVGDVTVNLIDTPGHPDFIAEVERALRVLDGAVLVVSAVEGVQAQTRVLMRTLRRLGVPTLLFVNKIDRAGARPTEVLREIAAKLTPRVVALNAVRGPGTPAATTHPPGDDFAARVVEATGDDDLLAAFVRDELSYPKICAALAERARSGEIHPAFFGSAVTGAGVDALIQGLADLLPVAAGDPAAPVSGTVFKVERDRAGARIAYVRMFDGTLRVRDRLPAGVVTAIEGGPALRAGEIGKVHGLREVRIGDAIGQPHAGAGRQLFPPPALETVVVARDPADRHALHTALAELADQDPLINLRADDTVSLYGEVQKEVIETTLAEQYGVAVSFRGTSTIHIERPAGAGFAGRTLGKDDNPYFATLDLRVEPAPIGSGVSFELDVPIEQVPIHVFRTEEFFRDALEATVRRALRAGLHGWEVIDVRVIASRTGFVAPSTTAADFRKLLPIVLTEALRRAGTVVCEPIHRFRLDGPATTLGPALGALSRLGAVPETSEVRGDDFVIGGLVPAARLRAVEEALPGLTHGEGVLESEFDSYRPVTGR
ncbi:translation factor GTPase family protein [Actinoplanes sp. NPDC051633]|uniref:translation factor GTPase family protein n=1 Tax=Actinoplanes sp. NPDC051633 TaxID=3155670 RepID=UPI003424010C